MDIAELEQQRLALEESLEKLRQSLKHWQTWDAEYEGLKEELTSGESNATTEDLTKLAKTFGGDLVNEKEILDLTGLSKNAPRTAEQIVGLIERRQDYVQKNIETVQRRFFDAEAKQEELAFAAAPHGEGGEGGLPLTEIYEELDEDGNVVSSSLSRPEDSSAQLVESLRKAGVREEDLLDGSSDGAKTKPEVLRPAITNATPPMVPVSMTSAPDMQTLAGSAVAGATGDSTHDEHERPSIRKKSVSFTADTKEPPKLPRPESEDGHKRVSFNEKVAVMPSAPPPDSRSVSFSPKVEEIPSQPLGPPSPNPTPTTEDELQKRLRESYKPGERVAVLNDDDELESIQVVLPENEPEEDARTRREMLDYHLNEVGNVVAQIDLDEAKAGVNADDDDDDDNMSFHTSSEYLDDEDTPYTTGYSDSEDEEDEFGRSTKPQITDEYRQQMKELQERLIGNLGPAKEGIDAGVLDSEHDIQDVKRLVIREKRNSASSASSENSEKKAGGKKRVSFAEELDVAEPGSPPLKARKHLQGENVGPVADTIAERATTSTSSEPDAAAPEKMSRFKRSRAVPTPAPITDMAIDDTDIGPDLDTPSGPPGMTLAPTLKERVPTHSAVAPPGDEHEDEVVQRTQLAEMYYRKRNEMIRSQGGFVKRDEDEGEGPLMEERDDGSVRKVSRFRAARLRPQGEEQE